MSVVKKYKPNSKNKLFRLSKKYEHWETDPWAVDSMYSAEKDFFNNYDGVIVDPCVGTGIIANKFIDKGHNVFTVDIRDWGYSPSYVDNFLKPTAKNKKKFRSIIKGSVVVMNPPFSKAVKFVEKCFKYGAVKVICFQRHAWMESFRRKDFWENYKASIIYVCGDRVTCWRHDVPKKYRIGVTPTAHSWFIFDKKRPSKTDVRLIYKKGHRYGRKSKNN